MDKNSRLQIPISLEKKELLDSKSEEFGFGSATDAVRFLINNFLTGSINIAINSNPISTLSKTSEIEVIESLLDRAKGKTREFDPRDKNFHKNLLKFADE